MTLKIIIAAAIISALFLIPRLLLSNQTENQQPGEHQASDPVTGKLLSCPDKPNCINTEYPEDTSHYLPPLDFPDSAKDQAMPLAKSIIREMGGKISPEETKEGITAENNYLAATFTSSLFRFVDDFELRQDNTSHTLHIRSASRTGYSDFGVNKRRVNKFSQQFKSQIKTSSVD